MVSDSKDATHLTRNIAALRPQLIKIARRYFGRDEAEDLVQTTMERALTKRDQFDPKTNILAWLKRILTNLMVDEWRRLQRHPIVALSAEIECPKSWAVPEEEAALWENFSREDILKALPTLSPQFRKVFELRQEYRLSYDEIAAQLRLRPGTVGTRLLRARQHLRQILVANMDKRRPTHSCNGRPSMPEEVVRRSA